MIPWNAPNLVTLARLVLAILFFACMQGHQFRMALVFFTVAALTDWLDGFLARRWGQITKFGRIFDSLVDKILICGAFVFLACQPRSGVGPAFTVIVLFREFLITAVRAEMEGQGIDFSAKVAGKVKMLLQVLAALASLGSLAFSSSSWQLLVRDGLVIASLAATILSGLQYLLATRGLNSSK